MKSFFSNLFTAFLGTLLALGALVFIIVKLIFSNTEPVQTVKPNSFLKLTFAESLPELTNNTEAGAISLSGISSNTIGLNDYIKYIIKAGEDKNIKGIYLELDKANVAFASSKQLRDAISKFKESGKFVYAYANAYSQRSYYLATVADSVFLHPLGAVDFTGFASVITYYKGLLDKVGVKATPFYAGKFKSATEPFRRENMSEENRLQTREFIEGMYDLYLQTISKSRNLDIATLRNIADNALLDNAQATITHKMIDGLKYKDQIIDLLHQATGVDLKSKLSSLSMEEYINRNNGIKKEDTNKNTIAVIYAEGTIVDGEGANGGIGGDRYARIIRDLRKKDDVKAIVMRVNSGGGSALASDIIWRELELAKAQGIKIVASMGDYAASGGYYISSNADYIFAEENTLTGSIGVFGLLFNMGELYKNKLGLTVDTVKTGPFAAMASAGAYYGFNDKEAALIQKGVDEIYEVFKTRVSEGRKMSMEAVEEIAQGRVWLGSKATKIGLVDSLGNLQDAINYAAGLANIENYKTKSYPIIKDKIEELLEMVSGSKDNEQAKADLSKIANNTIENQIPQLKEFFKAARNIEDLKGVQTRLPFILEVY